MFPTTAWTRIHQAGQHDRSALERFAECYRQPVLRFIRGKGFNTEDAEDVCQDVFVRVLAGNVLARADQSKGRFRSLLLAVATHVIQDRWRRRREIPTPELEIVDRDPEFDRTWVLHLVERAMAGLRERNARYYAVLSRHLMEEPQNRNKLWIARRKLIALIRAEVAGTCASHADFEEEVAYLSTYLAPRKTQKK